MENENKTFDLKKIQNLKYGENPHQEASLYSYNQELNWEKLSDGVLSYNNILDMTVALEIAAEFYDVNAVVIVKHSNPCAVALGCDMDSAWQKAVDSDTVSIFRSVIAVTKEVDKNFASKLSLMSPGAVIAPKYSPDAIVELQKVKNLKIIQINTCYKDILRFNDEEIKITPFGALIQQKDTRDFDVKSFKVATKKKPEQKELEDMIFAFKVAKHTKSNAIVIAKDLRTIGICGGQTTRIGSVEIALSKVCDSTKGAVIASDGFIPSTDNIQAAVQNRISAIIQPGGSIKDEEIIKIADKYEISMVLTGIRHYKH